MPGIQPQRLSFDNVWNLPWSERGTPPLRIVEPTQAVDSSPPAADQAQCESAVKHDVLKFEKHDALRFHMSVSENIK